MFKKLLEYLRYPSTWKGFVAVLTAVLGFFHYELNPETAAAIVTAGLAIVGLIDSFFSDADTAQKIADEKGE